MSPTNTKTSPVYAMKPSRHNRRPSKKDALSQPDTLPHKLSDLLALALKDVLRARVNHARYKLNLMAFYHIPVYGRVTGVLQHTEVCLAGCVMAMTLKVPRDEVITPNRFSDNAISRKLKALCYLRRGDIDSALNGVGMAYSISPNKQIDTIASSIANLPKDEGFNSKCLKLLRKLQEQLALNGY